MVYTNDTNAVAQIYRLLRFISLARLFAYCSPLLVRLHCSLILVKQVSIKVSVIHLLSGAFHCSHSGLPTSSGFEVPIAYHFSYFVTRTILFSDLKAKSDGQSITFLAPNPLIGLLDYFLHPKSVSKFDTYFQSLTFHRFRHFQ